MKPEDVPKSALDFLKPMFMGKAISVYPADDDAALYLFHIIAAEVRLGLDGEIHREQGELCAGPPAGGARAVASRARSIVDLRRLYPPA